MELLLMTVPVGTIVIILPALSIRQLIQSYPVGYTDGQGGKVYRRPVGEGVKKLLFAEMSGNSYPYSPPAFCKHQRKVGVFLQIDGVSNKNLVFLRLPYRKRL